MSTIEVVNHITLDGVMQAPADPDEDRRGGFEHGGWATPYSDEVHGQVHGRADERAAAASCCSGAGPTRSSRTPGSSSRRTTRSGSGSRPARSTSCRGRPRELGWQNSVLLEGDAAETVADLKAREDGNIVILGSGELVRALLPHGLIDAFLLTIHPLVLGSGRRLFADDGALARFNLVESKPTTTGVLIARYEAA